jgi:hypothetical protein
MALTPQQIAEFYMKQVSSAAAAYYYPLPVLAEPESLTVQTQALPPPEEPPPETPPPE